MGFASSGGLINSNSIRKMSEEIEVKVQSSLPREELIRTAISFLTNPNVQKSPASQKEAFLKKKGLTVDEIKIAFEKSSNQIVNATPVYPIHVGDPVQSTLVKGFWFQRIKETLNIVALLIGATYGLYYLYKKLLEPLLFGRPKKPNPLENSISSLKKTLEKSVNDLKNDMQKVQYDLERVVIMQNEQQSHNKQVGDLKSEVATIKGILLSRHQFAVNLSGPSIPAWQLSRSTHKDDKESIENEDGEHNSGSSETEIVPNSNGGSQGSDSSLEMIKEVDN